MGMFIPKLVQPITFAPLTEAVVAAMGVEGFCAAVGLTLFFAVLYGFIKAHTPSSLAV